MESAADILGREPQGYRVALTPARRLPHRTTSICQRCHAAGSLTVVDATLEERDGAVWMIKQCPRHGRLESLRWQRVEHFEHAHRIRYAGQRPRHGIHRGPCPTGCGLCPEHQSVSTAGLVEVADDCDLGCPVCFAGSRVESGPKRPSLDEIEKRLQALRDANQGRGPATLQLIGGEPTLRPDLPELVRLTARMGFGWTHLSTNGLRLAAEPELAGELGQAGLKTLYLQFDSLQDRAVERLRGRRGLVEVKRRALSNAARAGIDRNILVMVLARGVNPQNVGGMIRFAIEHRDSVAGICFQPMARVGRCRGELAAGPRYGMSDLLIDVERQTEGRIRVSDWMPWSVYTPLVRYFLASSLEPGPASETTPDPLCGLHTLVVVEDDGRWNPISAYLDPLQATRALEEALTTETRPGGRLHSLAGGAGLSLSDAERRTVSRQLVGTLLMGAVSRAATGRPLEFILDGLRTHAGRLLSDDLRLVNFISVSPRVMLLAAMDFMDPETFDLERLSRCCVHYAAPDQRVIPFCAMNNIHRPGLGLGGRP